MSLKTLHVRHLKATPSVTKTCLGKPERLFKE